MFFARAVDLLSTLLVTPDLSREVNPIYRLIGWKWILILNGLLVLFAQKEWEAFPYFFLAVVGGSYGSALWNMGVYLFRGSRP